MGLFDIFKKKQPTREVATQQGADSNPEVTTAQEQQQEAQSEERLEQGLEKTRRGFFEKLSRAVVGKSKVDDEVLDSLEEVLVTSDVGIDTTLRIIERIESRVARDKYVGTTELQSILREETVALLGSKSEDIDGFSFEKDSDGNPFVVMVVGVNGVGKTTTIGKIASRLESAGKRVYIGAADTFRAAAIDQLEVWADRAGAKIIKQKMGSDPASVAYDTISSAKAAGADVVLIDTAGRLHNKVGLMNELTKIRNVMRKIVPSSPHEVLLVLDGSTGQNAYEQAKQFTAATDVTALAITKLDGTAKGGVVIGISDSMNIPVRFIGVGEKVEDLQIFEPRSFVDNLFRG
ncbi:MAG: signal recognition particle-docking protein FtsY [Rikenellaceae bacterium]